MMVSKITTATIYETPDGIETVYMRENGSAQTVLVKDEVGIKTLSEKIQEDKLWGEIRRAAKTNPTIQRALDEAILLYQLSK